MKINPNKLVMDTVVLLPIATLFQGTIPIINKVIFFVVIGTLLYIFLINKKSAYEIMILIMFGVSYIIAAISTEGSLDNANEIFYLLFFMLFSDYVILKYEYIKYYLQHNYNYLKKLLLYGILW